MRAKTRPLPLGTLFPVKGVSFRQEDVKKVVEGDEVRIRHVRDNRYDPHACAVETLDGTVLGFVERTINRRLALVHPGGTWRGVVEIVYRRQTWGLRVRLLELLTQESNDFGASRTGARHLGDGVYEGPHGQVVSVETQTQSQEEINVPTYGEVVALSGRVLGRFVGEERGMVYVKDTDGILHRYPKAVVTIQQIAELSTP